MSRPLHCLILFLPLLLTAPKLAHCDEAIPADPEPRWWKGNIHTHSLWSDGNDFPEMISEWYRTHEYNFLALSDHNILSEGQRWMKLSKIKERSKDHAFEKYVKRFGPHWVETRGPAGDPESEVRLKPLEEFRALLEERGKFIMIQGEEISDSVQGKPVHMNATNVNQVFQPLGGESVAAAIDANLRSVESNAAKQGREVLVHLNHPNFGYGVSAQELASVLSERFFEVYNGHPGVNQLGDADHPSIEKLWDIANTIRTSQLDGPLLLGVATDDSHNYHDSSGSTPGRGWIMVRARHLTPESLIRAMDAGDFYASSGVSIQNIDNTARELSLTIIDQPGATFSTQFIGTRLPQDGKQVADSDVGVVLATVDGLTPSYRFKGDELYVRATVTSSRQHPNPSFDDQAEQAWTQPVRPMNAFPGEQSTWNGYPLFEFPLPGSEDIACKVVAPHEAATGRPWIWRARFWGHEPQTDLALLKAGYHVAYCEVGNLFGNDEAVSRWNQFYDFVTTRHGLSDKVAIEAMSRGGLIAYNWASSHPERVACIYADAPVCDIRSWPGGILGEGQGHNPTWLRCLEAYGLSADTAQEFDRNPIDRLQPLAKHEIPLLHVVGDADKVVPVADNTTVLEQRYKSMGGHIHVIHKPGVGHHPHSLKDPTPIVEFVRRHSE